MSVMYRALRKLKKADATAGGLGRGVPVGQALDEREGELPVAVKVTLGAIPVIVLGLGAGYWYTQQGKVDIAEGGGEGQKSSLMAARSVTREAPSAPIPLSPVATAIADSLPSAPATAVSSSPSASVPPSSGVADTMRTVRSESAAVAASAVPGSPPGKIQAKGGVSEADAARLEQILGGISGEQPDTRTLPAAKTAPQPAEAKEKALSLAEATPATTEKRASERRGESAEKKIVSQEGKNQKGASKDAPGADGNQESAVAGEIKKKTVATAHAVFKMKRALAAGDTADVDAGLNSLAGMKGENNPFVMKMQAYVYMREGKYAQAGSLLEEVLKVRKNDLDAAKNMVIVEMKTNQNVQAQERLKELLRRYPNDRQLRDLRQYLN
ncbi:MAG: tetratricopeptide repeat protein [Magnetococcales bacterium]|nr:tetratricopeptide repeat protein [Magnetococcales bacterium]